MSILFGFSDVWAVRRNAGVLRGSSRPVNSVTHPIKLPFLSPPIQLTGYPESFRELSDVVV